MLGLSSSLLLASLMNRSFAHLGGPDVCGWMQGPLCSWRELPEKAMWRVSVGEGKNDDLEKLENVFFFSKYQTNMRV